MTDDVVAELDRWMADWPLARRRVMKRARDEIVALQQLQLASVEANKWLHDNDERIFLKATDIACLEARDEALEEAAMVADRWEERPEFDGAAAIAKAIRALKDRTHD